MDKKQKCAVLDKIRTRRYYALPRECHPRSIALLTSIDAVSCLTLPPEATTPFFQNRGGQQTDDGQGFRSCIFCGRRYEFAYIWGTWGAVAARKIVVFNLEQTLGTRVSAPVNALARNMP